MQDAEGPQREHFIHYTGLQVQFLMTPQPGRGRSGTQTTLYSALSYVVLLYNSKYLSLDSKPRAETL